MLEWIFNISIISLLIILIFQNAFDFFSPQQSKDNLVNLKVQKYKNIIETMVQQQKEKDFKKAYEEETGNYQDDSLEELELYIQTKTA